MYNSGVVAGGEGGREAVPLCPYAPEKKYVFYVYVCK